MRTANILDGNVTEPKLATGVQDKLHTDTEILGIVRQEEANRFVETLMEWQDQTASSFAGQFTIDGTSWTFSDADDYSASDDTLGVDFVRTDRGQITQAEYDSLARYHLAINRDGTNPFVRAIVSGDHSFTELDRSLDLTFHDVPDNPWTNGADNEVIIGEPLTVDNYIQGEPSSDRQIYTRVNNKFGWYNNAARTGFRVHAPLLTADLVQTTTATFTYTAWETLLTLPAVTAAQAGDILLHAHVHGVQSPAAGGGGERGFFHSRIRRTRASTTITVEDNRYYGPRHLNGANGIADIGDDSYSVPDTAQEGDVYFLEVQSATQQSGQSMTFTTTDNMLTMAAMGGVQGPQGPKGDAGLEVFAGTASQVAAEPGGATKLILQYL